jgi:sec-independent protein translocase protein TatA
MIGSGELMVILCVAMVLFGGKKLPEFAKNLGKGIREFKKAAAGIEEEIEERPIAPEKKKTVSLPDSKDVT